MHYYSIDSEIRKNVIVILAITSLSLPTIFENLRTFLGINQNLEFSISFGLIFGILYWTFEYFIWKILSWMKLLPNLNGKWTAKGISSFFDPETGQNSEFEMRIKIKQTFSKIEIFAQSNSSTSKSIMASIETQRAVPVLRYAYDNEPDNMANQELQRHPGLMALLISSDNEMKGDYFSGKHRLRYGELTLTREQL
jgi:hypothetical protein